MCPPARVPTPRQSHPRRPQPVLVACARARVAQPVLLCGATFVRSAVTRALQPAILPIAVHGLPVDSSHSVSGGLGPANKTLLCPRGKCELLAREYSHRRRRSRYTCGGRTSVRRPTGCLLDPYATPCHAPAPAGAPVRGHCRARLACNATLNRPRGHNFGSRRRPCRCRAGPCSARVRNSLQASDSAHLPGPGQYASTSQFEANGEEVSRLPPARPLVVL